MSYEEISSVSYRAECKCGKGFLRYYKITLENDWWQRRESSTEVEIFCDSCKEKYHYENDYGNGYLVPNGLTFPKRPHLDYKAHFNFEEDVVQEFGEEGIKVIIADMTSPKHRYMKHLTTEEAKSFANKWLRRRNKKSLAPMVEFLKNLLKDFHNIKANCDKKKVMQNKYDEELKAYWEERRIIEEQSFKLVFQYDEKARCEREEYEEAHRYDPFTAQVKYDSSFSRDWTNQFWDTYLIKECTDAQYLTLSKSIVGTPEITIAKKYKCVCQLCGVEKEVLSSDFKIGFDHETGYYPEPCCSCHSVSSFEAKVMKILNDLGVTYVREIAFEGLVSDFGKNLRFDFGLYRGCDGDGFLIIDLIVELQGPHHYKEGYYDEYGEFVTNSDDTGINTRERLERQTRYDEKKKQFCLTHGINLEYIKYTVSGDYGRLEKNLIDILQKYGYEYWR